jgi:hypothetical protein
MKPINIGRALLGGIVAAVIINLIETVVNGVVLKDDWAAAMQALGKSGEVTGLAIAIYWIGGLLEGVIGVGLYAGLTGRYGLGSTTAAKAGLVVWALASAIPNLMWVPSGMIPSRLMTFGVVVDFIAILLGVTMGALLYREQSAPLAQTARA